jgi:predicted phage terminase large subunit-like protein
MNDIERELKVEDCRRLYLKHDGKRHELIEKEMRALGHGDFHRRVLHRRFERGRCRMGWIERYGFERLLKDKGKLRIENGELQEIGNNAPVPLDVPQGCAFPAGVITEQSAAVAKHVFDDKFDEFKLWLEQVSPGMTWDWKYQVYIYKRLKKVMTGDLKRLMIFMPPRHGKSEMVTVRFTAYCLKDDPSKNVIIGCYNQRLANRFSRKIKRVLCEDSALEAMRAANEATGAANIPARLSQAVPGTPSVSGCRHDDLPACPFIKNGGEAAPNADARFSGPAFPFASSRPKNSEAEWETSRGGGLRAVGVGAGVTGFGADLIVIDDPVKSRAEAESQAYRDNVWDWFNDDIYTRLEPDGSIILIQTRWHEDDLAGRLLRGSHEEGAEKWEVIDLPALAATGEQASLPASPPSSAGVAIGGANGVAETGSSDATPGLASQAEMPALRPDPLGRAPGEALCPQRYNERSLARVKAKIGSYSFAALYQQHPVPAAGGLFKRHWFRDKIVAAPPPGLRWSRATDPGISAGAGADYTASFRVAFDRDETMYIDGGYRRQIEYPELRRFILGRMAAERDTRHGIELAANGNAIFQDVVRVRTGTQTLRGIRPKKDKVSRALRWLALAEQGKVYLTRAAWNDELLDELCSFPLGTHDDQIDAISLAFELAKQSQNGLAGFKY